LNFIDFFAIKVDNKKYGSQKPSSDWVRRLKFWQWAVFHLNNSL